MDMQVAFEQAQALGREGQFVGDSDTIWRNFVRAKQDAPLTGDQATGPVAGRGGGFTDLDAGFIRAGLAYLGSIGRDQAQVDGVDTRPGREVPMRDTDLTAAVAFIVVGERERFNVGRHRERDGQILAFLFVPDEVLDAQ